MESFSPTYGLQMTQYSTLKALTISSVYYNYDASMQVGLNINMSKTQVMGNISKVANPSVIVGNEILKIVNQYVYLGHILSIDNEHQMKGINYQNDSAQMD